MLPHNEKTYNELKSYTDNGLDCCVVNPCGSGKTTIIERFIEDNPLKSIIIFTKQKNAKDYYRSRSNVFDGVDIVTYSMMHKDCHNNRIGRYKKDIYIFDEAHYIGAEVWSEDIQNLMARYSPLAIGFTATPQRYVDQGTANTIVDQYFSGHSAGNFTDRQLQKMGIFKEPEYVLSLYSVESDIATYREKIGEADISEAEKSRYLGMLDDAEKKWRNEYSPEKILADKLPQYMYKKTCNRILVYIPNVADMPQYIKDVTRAVEKACGCSVKAYSYTYKDPEVNLVQFLQEDDTKIKILFSIDKIMETIHIDDLNIAIMLRPSVSNRIITQQFGRINSIGNDNKPIIFDMVGNLDNLSDIMKAMGNRSGRKEESKKDDSFRFNFNLSFAWQTKSIFDAIDNIIKRYNLYEHKGFVGTLTWFAEVYGIEPKALKKCVNENDISLSEAIKKLAKRRRSPGSQQYVDGLPKEYDFTLTDEQKRIADKYIPTVDRFIANHKIKDDDLKQELYMAMLYGLTQANDTFVSTRIGNALRKTYTAYAKAKIRQASMHWGVIEEDTLVDEADLTDVIAIKNANRILKEKMEVRLTPRQEKVLTERFGLDDGVEQGLEEIGKKFSVSRERIRQIEAKSLRLLRATPNIKIYSPKDLAALMKAYNSVNAVRPDFGPDVWY